MRRVFISSLLLCWSAIAFGAAPCGDNPTIILHARFDRAIAHWDRFLQTLEDRSALAPQLELYRTAHGYPLSVWPATEKTTMESVPHLASEGPCGIQFLIMAKSLAAKAIPGGSQVSTDTVMELDARGHIQRQWRVPLGGLPTALRGDTLFVADAVTPICPKPPVDARTIRTVWLGIAPNGNFQITAAEAAVPPPQHTKCGHIEAFQLSDYTRCIILSDLTTRAKRRLAYEGPCT